MKAVIFPLEERFTEYLADEAQFSGTAESVSFPRSEEAAREILAELHGTPVTIQGGKTGVTGGSVPEGGHIMNFSRMNRIKDYEVHSDGSYRLTVEPGVTLLDLRKALTALPSTVPLFWPVEPTEPSATIGGIAATGARGICSAYYGKTEKHILEARLLSADGSVRTVFEKDSRDFPLSSLIGSEGIAGAFTELTLNLLPKPKSMWGIMFFFADEAGLCTFADALRSEVIKSADADIAAIEYIDGAAISMIETRKPYSNAIRGLPDVEKPCEGLIYLELHGEDSGIESLALPLMELAKQHGSNGERAWAVSGEAEVEKMRSFRHTAAESANLHIASLHQEDRRITKLSTDMICMHESFTQTLARYRQGLQNRGITGCIFGHVRGGHLHVNILPRNYTDYQEGISLIRQWAQDIAEIGGTVIGEHGIGKLKKQLLAGLIPESTITRFRRLKAFYDASGIWNRGNIFDISER